MSSVLITGSSRGIGLEFCKQLVAHSNPPSVLIATCRNPDAAQDLQALAKKHSNLRILKLDVLDFKSYESFVEEVKGIVGDKGLNVLINNAGICKSKKESLSEMNVEDMTDTLLTNTVAPIMMIKALRPLLKLAADTYKDLPMGWARASVLNISSGLGSIASNTTGGFLEYRESKAALNMAVRSLVVELGPEGILILNIHPGWVQTDMGSSAADLTVQESVGGMLSVFYGLKPEHNGSFVQWEGKVLPW